MKPSCYIISWATFLFVFALSACQNNSAKQQKIVKAQHSNIKSATMPNNNVDTIITAPCAILINPTTFKVDSMKRLGEEDFYIGADDYIFYMSTAGEFLDSMKIKKIYRKSTGLISFKTNTGQLYNINLSNYTWGLLLFNGKSKPFEADVTMVKEGYQSYMEK